MYKAYLRLTSKYWLCESRVVKFIASDVFIIVFYFVPDCVFPVHLFCKV